MIIQLKRFFVGSGESADVLINTDFIIRVEPVMQYDKPATRILMNTLRHHPEGPDIVYTNETVAAIYRKIKPPVTRKKK